MCPKVIQPNSGGVINRTRFSRERHLNYVKWVIVRLLAEQPAHSRHLVRDSPFPFLDQLSFRIPHCRSAGHTLMMAHSFLSLLGKYSCRDHSWESTQEERYFIHPTHTAGCWRRTVKNVNSPAPETPQWGCGVSQLHLIKRSFLWQPHIRGDKRIVNGFMRSPGKFQCPISFHCPFPRYQHSFLSQST